MEWEPREVKESELIFGGREILGMMPSYSDIPEEFRRGQTKWNTLIDTWFFSGAQGLQVKTNGRVDPEKALRHVTAIIRSFVPKHEHKTAGCAYLCSLWFDDYKLGDKDWDEEESDG